MGKCLIDYVGIRICPDSDEEPGSGMYINTLPGISLEMIDKTATDDQVTYAQLWQDAQLEAWYRFLEDFILAVSECYELTKDCNYEQMLCANKRRLVTAWRFLLGNQLMIYRLNTTRLNKFTLIDDKQARELADFYQVQYEKFLATAVQLIDVSACRCSLVAEPTPKMVQWLP